MKLLLSVFIFVFLVGCQQDPYPEEGELRENPRQQRNVRLALSADIPQEIYFQEGNLGEHRFRVKVPAPGNPIMWIDGLPSGATFDEENFRISWRPGNFAGNDSKDPTIKTRIYPITVWLRSSDNAIEKISRNVSLIVRDVPRQINISGNDDVEVREGSKLSYEFEVNNDDYPQGPFSVFTADMPANTKVKKVSGSSNKFILEFEPDNFHVQASDRNCGTWSDPCKKYEGSITITNPAGHQKEKKLTISVKDTRLGVKTVTPTNLEQGLDVSFQIISYDLNKEITPEVRLKSSTPNVGNFSTQVIRNEESFSTVYNIKWHDIPPTYNGQVVPFEFYSCVNDVRGRRTNCSSTSMNVAIKVKERKAPLINRSSWNIGELVYLGFNQLKNFTITVEDGEDRSLATEVEVFPESIRNFVTWRNGKLSMRFNKKGTFQFSLVATSQYNVQSAQSFIVEVFPENRSKVLFLADSTKDKEVQFYKKVYPDLDLMNPVIQEISTRNVSNRETLIIGTSILKDMTVNEKIIKAMDYIENIVIASPLLENLPEKYLRELNQDYGVVFYRYNDLSSAEDLDKMYLDGMNIFPKDKIRLAQNTTDVSENPLIFNTKSSARNCRPVLDLMNDIGSQIHKIGIICNRSSGGRLALLGTEWADLATSNDDKLIPQRWMKKMLTMSVNKQGSINE